MIFRGPNTAYGRGTVNGLPSWVPAANTVATIPETNTFASIAPADSPVGGWSYDYLGTLQYSGSASFAKIINDFSGGVYNPYLGSAGSMIFHGGGHAATRWNGVVAFDLHTLLYSIWMDGSNTIDTMDGTNTEYGDGQPMSSHTYDTEVILGPEAGYAKGALMTPLRVAAEPHYSYNSTAAHLFDFNNPSIKWTRLAAHNSAFPDSPGGATAYDADLGRVWWVCNTNQSGYQQYFDLASNTQQKITLTLTNSSGAPSADSQCLRYDSARKLLILIDVPSGGSTTRRVQYFDTTSPTTGWTQATLSGAFPDTAAGQGFAFDRAADGTYLCNVQADLTKIYRLTIPATLTDSWPVTQITYAGTTLKGVYVMGKRWSYVPVLQSFVGKAAAADSHQIYKV